MDVNTKVDGLMGRSMGRVSLRALMAKLREASGLKESASAGMMSMASA